MDRSLDRSVQLYQGLESALIEIEDGIPVLTSKVCRKCGKEFSDTNGKVQYCSDECRSIAKAKRLADEKIRSRETNKGARRKLDRCSTPKCKNRVSRKLPDGTPVCRTCLAKHNVYGGVNKPSPTISHPGTGFRKKGFAHQSTREESSNANSDWEQRNKDIRRKKQKAWFAIAKKKYKKSGATKAFLDYRKDAIRS